MIHVCGFPKHKDEPDKGIDYGNCRLCRKPMTEIRTFGFFYDREIGRCRRVHRGCAKVCDLQACIPRDYGSVYGEKCTDG